MDGSSPRQQFFHITLPLLTPAIVISQFLLLTGGLRVYDLPFTLTKGGPGYATTTITQSIITNGVAQGRYGLASALSVLFTLVGGRPGRRATPRLPPAGKARLMNNSKERTSPLTAVVMIPVALIVGAAALLHRGQHLQDPGGDGRRSPFALPTQLFLRQLRHGLRHVPLVQSFANTLFVTVLSLVLDAGHRLHGRLRHDHAATPGSTAGSAPRCSSAFIMPSQSTLIPLYRMLVRIGLVDTLTGLVFLYSAGSIFCYFLIQGYMRSVPYELIEAARIDGASAFAIYWRIVLPLIRPILVTVAVFQTMWIWNDFITPNVFSGLAREEHPRAAGVQVGRRVHHRLALLHDPQRSRAGRPWWSSSSSPSDTSSAACSPAA